MRNDPGSNYTLAEEIAAASHAAGEVEGASVDHAAGSAVSFFITAGTFGTGATLNAKVQHSSNGTDWTDDDGASGNDTAITELDAAGTAQINVPNPQARYSRVLATAADEAVVFGVVSVLGPLRHITPS